MTLPIDGIPMLRAVLNGLPARLVRETVVVLGGHRRRVRAVLQGLPVREVVNRRYRKGMLTSIQAGFRSIPPDTGAVFIVLGDQPGIPAAVFEALDKAFRRSDRGIVVPVFGGRRGHPLLISASYKEEIESLNPAVGLRQLLERHSADILEVPVKAAAVLRDIDTPEDYFNLDRA